MTLPVNELEALIKDLRWEHFEADHLGQIQVGNKLFCMRVGIHMSRPVQAIVCEGQFVRMRSAEFYEDRRLHKIDPERLAECLYMDTQQQASWPKWRPLTLDQNKLQNEMMKAAQSQHGVAQGGIGGGGFVGGGGGGGIGGVSPTGMAKIQKAQMLLEIEKVRAEIQGTGPSRP